MLLALDIGNTETTLGLFQGERLTAHWRLTTTPHRTPDEWAAAITAYLTQAGHSTQEVRAAIVASVVPQVTQGVSEAVERATTVRPQVVDARSRLPPTATAESPGDERPDGIGRRRGDQDGRGVPPQQAPGAAARPQDEEHLAGDGCGIDAAAVGHRPYEHQHLTRYRVCRGAPVDLDEVGPIRPAQRERSR